MTTPQGFQEAAGHFGGDHGLLPSEVMPCFASALPACMAQWKCWQHALGGLPQCKRAQTAGTQSGFTPGKVGECCSWDCDA